MSDDKMIDRVSDAIMRAGSPIDDQARAAIEAMHESGEEIGATIRVLKKALGEISSLRPKDDDHCGRLAVKIAKDILNETGDWPHA